MNDRDFLIHRAILRCLKESKPYTALVGHLRQESGLLVPRLSMSEFDERLAAIEEARLAVSVRSERGLCYSITAEGEAWLLNNR